MAKDKNKICGLLNRIETIHFFLIAKIEENILYEILGKSLLDA